MSVIVLTEQTNVLILSVDTYNSTKQNKTNSDHEILSKAQLECESSTRILQSVNSISLPQCDCKLKLKTPSHMVLLYRDYKQYCLHDSNMSRFHGSMNCFQFHDKMSCIHGAAETKMKRKSLLFSSTIKSTMMSWTFWEWFYVYFWPARSFLHKLLWWSYLLPMITS